jgi:hypothetical protein
MSFAAFAKNFPALRGKLFQWPQLVHAPNTVMKYPDENKGENFTCFAF